MEKNYYGHELYIDRTAHTVMNWFNQLPKENKLYRFASS